MYKIIGQITGTADLLFNQMTQRELDNLVNGSTGGKPMPGEWETDALSKVPRDEHGCYINPWMFKQVLTAGARAANLKEGRKSIAPFITATVFADGNIYLTPGSFDYMHTSTGKRPPRTGGACMIYRPAFRTGWSADFRLSVLDDRRNPEQLRTALEHAGFLVGMGSWRPEYGRFIVTSWEVE